MTQSGFLAISKGTLHYWRYGEGPELFIALHGFGGDGRVFNALGNALQAHQSLVALELPWHGQTQWPAHSFGPEDFVEAIAKVLEITGQSRFSAIGFSFGGRLWLSTLETWAPVLDRLYLVSPDGIATRWKGWTEPLPVRMRQQMARFIENPKPALNLADWLYRKQLLHRYGHRFLHRHLPDPGRRQRLVQTWVAAARFPVRFARLRSYLKQSGLPVCVVIGESDPLIDRHAFARLAKEIPQICLRVLKGDHELLRRPEWLDLLSAKKE